MLRDPRALLWDALAAARLVTQFAGDATAERFETDDLVSSAVERQLEIFGEALAQLAKVAPDLAAQLPDVRRAIDFRNLLIHGYAAVTRRRVWAIVHGDLPAMAEAIQGLLTSLDPRPPG